MFLRYRPTRALAILSLLAVGFATPLAAQTNLASAPAPASVALASIDIENFGQVDPMYFRGAQPKGRDYADLAAIGVKTIINLTSDDADANEQSLTERAGMKYLQFPMTTRVAPTVKMLSEFLAVVNDPASQPVYVHCVGGRHRTGLMTAVYRMTQDGWTADQAFKEMKRYKFGADFLHPEFKAFVLAYRPPAGSVPALATSTTRAQ
jgi:tyrosine-protein phosphatase SIW14